ncbi:hypothetical protein SUGI_0779450 [Cryptomeria japonica]|nr:hypothetical protein SUGI_0779450 [Cryptomeria japonica]
MDTGRFIVCFLFQIKFQVYAFILLRKNTSLLICSFLLMYENLERMKEGRNFLRPDRVLCFREVSLPPRQPEEIEEGEFIADQSRDDRLIPSSPCPHEESPLEKLGMPTSPVTPCVKKGDPSLAFKDGMGREMEALPLSSDQATRLDDRSNFNSFPHLKEGEIIEERVDQEEDLARKEEEANDIINYLCDSVTEEIMDKLLDEIIDKDELNLQKQLLSKVILALFPPIVFDMEELLLDLDYKENESLGIELWPDDKSTPDCAKSYKKTGRNFIIGTKSQ